VVLSDITRDILCAVVFRMFAALRLFLAALLAAFTQDTIHYTQLKL